MVISNFAPTPHTDPLDPEAHIWDISPPVDEHSAVFPGDAPYAQTTTFTLDAACPVNVHALSLSPHTGAHADAPLHYANGERSSGQLPLAPYLGPCRVIHAKGFEAPGGVGPLVRPEHLAHGLSAPHLPPRVLVRTSRCASQSWGEFSALCPTTMSLFATLNIALIGIDTPSVDPAVSPDLPSHRTLLAHDMRVLENLVLDDVPEGDYELIALPLKLMRSDASPVRAILRPLQPRLEPRLERSASTTKTTPTPTT